MKKFLVILTLLAITAGCSERPKFNHLDLVRVTSGNLKGCQGVVNNSANIEDRKEQFILLSKQCSGKLVFISNDILQIIGRLAWNVEKSEFEIILKPGATNDYKQSYSRFFVEIIKDV